MAVAASAGEKPSSADCDECAAAGSVIYLSGLSQRRRRDQFSPGMSNEESMREREEAQEREQGRERGGEGVG